jgi:hypothetical protein
VTGRAPLPRPLPLPPPLPAAPLANMDAPHARVGRRCGPGVSYLTAAALAATWHHFTPLREA